MSFIAGQSVMYNSKCCTITRTPGKRITGEIVTGYLVRENKSGTPINSHSGLVLTSIKYELEILDNLSKHSIFIN